MNLTVTTPNGTSPTSKKDDFTFLESGAEASAIEPSPLASVILGW